MAEKIETASTPSDAKVSPQPLSSFLKRLAKDIDGDLRTATEETSEFLSHCKKRYSSLLEQTEGSQAQDFKSETLKNILQDTARMVLDYTYLDETLLVDAEFPTENATTRIAAIQEQLDKISLVATECFENQPIVETLGEEVVECLHWRKGALLYMYCHTLETNSRPTEPAHYQQCLEEGVNQLEKMLSTRRPTAVPENVSADDTLQLFSQGVYSDTHLLAVMYAAELCYWHQKAVDKGQLNQDSSNATSFSARQQGLQHLDTYLRAVKGPLKDQDWNTSRAKELVQYLRQSQ